MKKFIDKFRKNPYQIFYLIAFPIFAGPTFSYMNRPWGKVRNLWIGLDDLIPVVPPFVTVYHFYMPVLLAIGFMLFYMGKDKDFYSYVTALFLGHIFGYITFYFFQTIITRPDIATLGDDVFSNMLKWTYSVDNNYSGFPSLHVTDMVIAMLMILHMDIKRMKWPMLIFCFLIAISTVLIKQHVFLDIPGGILYGSLIFYLSRYLVGKIEYKKVRKSELTQ